MIFYLKDRERDIVLDVPVGGHHRDGHRHDLGHEAQLLPSPGGVELDAQAVQPDDGIDLLVAA